jgi:hypothetical protein
VAKSAPRKKTTLPRYTEQHGWTGGDSRTLYAFTDRRTGKVGVHPGGGSSKAKLLMHWGPEADVRIATRSEAEDLWQRPLHVGWNVAESSSAHATKKRGPYIAYWIRSRGPGSARDSVPIYVLGTTTRADEGIVGYDLRARPLRLGKGPYTMVISPDDVEDKP